MESAHRLGGWLRRGEQESGKPLLIEQRFLMSRLPDGTNFVRFTPRK
jgi:hypothetical protein